MQYSHYQWIFISVKYRQQQSVFAGLYNLYIYKVRPRRKDMGEIQESYRRIGDKDDRFGIDFWQSQGEQAIFAAALDMIQDYLIIRYGHADKPRLQRTVESFGKT